MNNFFHNTINENSKYSDIHLYHCGSGDCPPGHLWSAVRDHFLIHYIYNGKGIFQTNGITYNLKSGHGFLIYPETITLYKADFDNPWSYCWFGFNGLKAEEFLSRVGLSSKNPIFTYTHNDSLRNYIMQMIETQKLKGGREFLQTALIYNFFSTLAEKASAANTSDKSENTQEMYIKKAVEFIQRNYSRKMLISELSGYIGINRKYLCSLFRNTLNLSPQQFLMKFRIEKAIELMKNKSLSFSEIAHSVGYEDALLFSKMFKKIKGVSPRDYRKNI